jgi:predicted nucleic acid-binding Zn ribbon protein
MPFRGENFEGKKICKVERCRKIYINERTRKKNKQLLHDILIALL